MYAWMCLGAIGVAGGVDLVLNKHPSKLVSRSRKVVIQQIYLSLNDLIQLKYQTLQQKQ